jgi:hypothetical protein
MGKIIHNGKVYSSSPQDILTIESEINTLNNDVTTINSSIGTAFQNIGSINTSINGINSNITTINSNITKLKASCKQFTVPSKTGTLYYGDNKWIQICSISSVSAFTLYISQLPSTASFEIISYGTSVRITPLAAESSSSPIDKIRVRNNNDTLYLDFHVSGLTSATAPKAVFTLVGISEAYGTETISTGSTTLSGTVVAQAALLQSPLHTYFNKNGMFRGANLNGIYSITDIYNMVHSDNFGDLFLGDYFDIPVSGTINNVTVSETVRWMIAGFDYGASPSTASLDHWLALVPALNGWGSSVGKMNTSATSQGGYIGTHMHTTILPAFESSINSALGGHLLTHKVLLTSSVDSTTGKANNRSLVDVKLCLMSSSQYYGFSITNNIVEMGNDVERFPVFNFIGTSKSGTIWLRDVYSPAGFYAGGGSSMYNRITNANANTATYICPYLFFG